MNTCRRLAIAFGCGILLAATSARMAVSAEQAATWSFAAGGHATCPNTITRDQQTIAVDLSALPEGAEVFRAVLCCRREALPGWQHETDRVVVAPAADPEQPLRLLPPRYASLDATAPVAAGVKAGKDTLELVVKSFPWWKPETLRLDVSFTGGTAKTRIPQATGLAARHRGGQTLLTFREPNPLTSTAELTAGQLNALRKQLREHPDETAFRIYRGTTPITAATIAAAELVDEIGPLSCYNGDYHGIYPQAGDKLPRYVVEDGAEAVPPGTGIYAHGPATAGKAYYAVSVAVNGEEDFGGLAPGSVLRQPIEEQPGPGLPVLQGVEKPEKFFYTEGVTLHHYVRWEAPPRCNLPSRAYDYLVVLGPDLAEPAPLNLVLHCWGSDFRGKGGAYSWFAWKDRRIGIGVASNQIPYDWWTCYHENRETWKPWTDGVTRDFTAKRLLSFVDFVASKWNVDEDRVCVSGESMGGAGSAFMGIRYPKRFAYLFSAVGVHDPAAIKGSGFHESYARVCGRMEPQIKHESGALTFDYLSDPLWLRKHPATDLPFVGFGNGKNDHGIGWSHVVDLVKALQETRQPHAMIWNLRGHGAGMFHAKDLDIRRNQSLPAFTECSLDDEIGTATKREKPEPFKHPWGEVVEDVYDGDPEGQINTYLRWKTDEVIDRRDQWAAVLYLVDQAPEGQCTVNVTPRRLQQLQVKPGWKFRWTNTSVADGRPAQSGEVVADRLGLLTVENVVVTKTGNRLRLAAKGPESQRDKS